MQGLEVYRFFLVEEEARTLASLFEQHGIATRVEVPPPSLVPGESPDTIYLLMAPSDFTKAKELEVQQVLDNFSQLPSDYYLFSFEDEELEDVLKSGEEWNFQDYIIAKKILEDRGKDISASHIPPNQRHIDHEPFEKDTAIIGWVFISVLLIIIVVWMLFNH